MKIEKVIIHNIRSIKDATIILNSFSLLVGENNAGKTNVITALRLFYEESGLKFSKERDFPKFTTDDNESWIDIEYSLTDDEATTLKDEYKITPNSFKVRRFFLTENKDLIGNIYGYENNTLSSTSFYGWKNVSSAKLGTVIYIPEMSKTSDNMKLSGPSPLREITNFVFKKAVLTSTAYSELGKALESFNDEFKQESTTDDFSLNGLVNDINNQISNWEISFGFKIGSLKPEDIVKNLLNHYITDSNLGHNQVDIDNLGQGLQRHIIYTLIRLASKYVDKKEPKKKEFSPDFNLILFEEPEAFLHPTQQELLNLSLKEISIDSQVLITTHSTTFVSKNISDLPSIIKIAKKAGVSENRQLTKMQIDELVADNTGLYSHFSALLIDDKTSPEIKKAIKDHNLGHSTPDMDRKLKEEAFRYSLWLDSERSNLFFSKHVILCEGATEKALFDYLLDTKWIDLKKRQIYIFDSLGKFNIHKFMNLLGSLGIRHSVLYDGDADKAYQQIVNDYITQKITPFTIKIDSFDVDLENYLGVTLPNRNDQKPVNVLLALNEGKITESKLSELKTKFESLIQE
ncbi:MAG: AAA family ATPase [Leptospiraceae bacterium]|nr:AAA family ATPase [Leptospiraceae bacterium]